MNSMPLPSTSPSGSDDSRKRGVAIILVLGMLALLMMMGVAFSITMRIERVGAGNFAQSVNTRQLVWGGLARAIDEINANMEYGTTNFIYPTWDVMRAGSSVGGRPSVLSWGKMKDFIPGSLREEAAKGVQFAKTASDSASGMQGQAAYVVLNLSYFLDANYVGGSTNRPCYGNGIDRGESQCICSTAVNGGCKIYLVLRVKGYVRAESGGIINVDHRLHEDVAAN